MTTSLLKPIKDRTYVEREREQNLFRTPSTFHPTSRLSFSRILCCLCAHGWKIIQSCSKRVRSNSVVFTGRGSPVAPSLLFCSKSTYVVCLILVIALWEINKQFEFWWSCTSWSLFSIRTDSFLHETRHHANSTQSLYKPTQSRLSIHTNRTNLHT